MLIANVSPRTGGKTTDSGYLAHALQDSKTKKAPQGYKPRGYDADHSRQFWQWGQSAGFPFEVELAASAKFHKEIIVPDGVIGIVDCGHSENHPDITDSVLRVADLVILHMAPTAGDFERIIDPVDKTTLADMIKRSAPLRADGQMPPAWVLLNRTVPNAGSTAHYRGEMEAEGWNVLQTTIPRSEGIAQSIGFPVVGAAKGPFGALVLELEERGLLG